MVLDGEECSGSNITSRFSCKEPQHDHALFWAFVTIKDKITNGGDNKFWSCNLIRIKEMQEELKSKEFKDEAFYLVLTLLHYFECN